MTRYCPDHGEVHGESCPECAPARATEHPYREREAGPLYTTQDKARERYLRDPAYHAVVDYMRGIIHHLQLTPGELRECAMLACIIEEERRPAPFHIPTGLEKWSK